MKRPVLYIFIGYVWTKTLLGLALHPYKSVREMTRNKVLVPVLFSPLIGLIILFVLGRMGSFVFELRHGFPRTLVALTLSTALISILLWQLLLLYLLASFYVGMKRR